MLTPTWLMLALVVQYAVLSLVCMVRVPERSQTLKHDSDRRTVESGRGATADRSKHAPPRTIREVGWLPACSCGSEPVPCTVLDPFCGSGTTGVVALKLHRSFLGIELQPNYVTMAKRRIGEVMPLFAGRTDG